MVRYSGMIFNRTGTVRNSFCRYGTELRFDIFSRVELRTVLPALQRAKIEQKPCLLKLVEGF